MCMHLTEITSDSGMFNAAIHTPLCMTETAPGKEHTCVHSERQTQTEIGTPND